jgi:hypothetical protein
MNGSIELAASVVVFNQELKRERLSIEDVMRICADCGIRALEVRDEEWFGLPPVDVSATEFDEACKRLKLLSTDWLVAHKVWPRLVVREYQPKIPACRWTYLRS